MKHIICIKKLGPIESCTCEINDFTVITGPQSNGKSTIAKSIYFFRTIKQDIFNIMQQGGPAAVGENRNVKWSNILKQRLRNKFLELFGTSWVMPEDMFMQYSFRDGIEVCVFLEKDTKNYDRNYIQICFSEKLEEYLFDLDMQSFSDITIKQLANKEQSLIRFFDDPYEIVFIPAGRNLITLLSTQLNYIFTSLENTQLRNIDYITRRYTELILKTKPLFKDGYKEIIETAKNDPEQIKKYKKHQPAINMLLEKARAIIHGNYRYIDGEERLYIDQNKYVKINFASSGQQEIVWVINLLFYYLFEDKKVSLILEEPESHLFPDSQQQVSEILSLFMNEGNQVLLTTHSPYILGTINYLMLAGQTSKIVESRVKALIHKRLWISAKVLSAFFVANGTLSPAVENSDGIALIKNDLIDGASRRINECSDAIIEAIILPESGIGG